MSQDLQAQAQKLAARPYSIVVLCDDSVPEEPLYVALNPELDGCMAQGITPDEAKTILEEFRVDYIEHLLKYNLDVPKPQRQ